MTEERTGSARREPPYDLRGLLTGTFYCQDCAARLCEQVSRLPGVLETECHIDDGVLGVTYDPAIARADELDSAVERLAFETTGSVGHAAYRLTGLD